MPPAVILALLAIVLLALAAVRLELNFRRSAAAGPGPRPHGAPHEPRSPKPEPRNHKPRLRAAPAGGYCQSTLSAAALRRGWRPVGSATAATPFCTRG